jgi:hypothetical protein
MVVDAGYASERMVHRRLLEGAGTIENHLVQDRQEYNSIYVINNKDYGDELNTASSWSDQWQADINDCASFIYLSVEKWVTEQLIVDF